MAFFWDVISQLRGHGFDSIAFKDYTGLVSKLELTKLTSGELQLN
jgi:pyruvate/oxaloacetate carboxyltransferase